MGRHIFGIDFDGLSVAGGCTVLVSLLVKHRSETVVRRSIFGIDLDGPVKFRNRVLGLAFMI